MALTPKSPEKVAVERNETFRYAMAALWSEQAQLPHNKKAYLGIWCDENSFTFFIAWTDNEGHDRKKASKLTLHEASANPHFNFTTVFRTLIRSAGF